jgi:hypothetical protein
MTKINGVEVIQASHLPEIVPFGDCKVVKAALKVWLAKNHMEVTESFFERRHYNERNRDEPILQDSVLD